MKWALLLLLASGNLFDTGLRYKSYADCYKNRENITMEIVNYVIGEGLTGYWYENSGYWYKNSTDSKGGGLGRDGDFLIETARCVPVSRWNRN